MSLPQTKYWLVDYQYENTHSEKTHINTKKEQNKNSGNLANNPISIIVQTPGFNN